jgi:hypothetical protein
MKIFETWQHKQLVPSLTKQNALLIKATTTCWPMVLQQQFNLIALFCLHYRMPLARVESQM